VDHHAGPRQLLDADVFFVGRNVVRGLSVIRSLSHREFAKAPASPLALLRRAPLGSFCNDFIVSVHLLLVCAETVKSRLDNKVVT
jgi:hypothetical protein